MQAYLQAYMTQMAGMQSVLTSLAGVKPPEGEGIKDDGKGGAAKAPADAAALLAGAAGAGGADALVPGYLQVPGYVQNACSLVPGYLQMQIARHQ